MTYRWRGVVLRMAVSVAAITAVLYSLRHKIDEAAAIMLTRLEWDWFLLAVAGYLGCHVLLALRLHLILQGQKIRLAFLETFYLCMVGNFFNLILPSAVGGDVAKAYYCFRRCGQKLEATTSVVLDRMMGFVSLMFMALVGLVFLNRELTDVRIARLVYVFLALVVVLCVFFASKRFARIFKFAIALIPERFRAHISDAYHAIYNYRRRKGIVGGALLLSLAAQALLVLIAYWMALGLGVKMRVWLFFILMPVISIVSMAPSLGGLGVREAGSVYLFSRYMPSETALALSLLLDILIYGLSVGAGIVFALRGELQAKVIHEIEAME